MEENMILDESVIVEEMKEEIPKEEIQEELPKIQPRKKNTDIFVGLDNFSYLCNWMRAYLSCDT